MVIITGDFHDVLAAVEAVAHEPRTFHISAGHIQTLDLQPCEGTAEQAFWTVAESLAAVRDDITIEVCEGTVVLLLT